MVHRKPKQIFVAGTDTDVGKTFVGALLIEYLVASGRSVGVYKPVASGCQELLDGSRHAEDADRLWKAATQHLEDRNEIPHEVCPQRFLAPLAPPDAAELENQTVDTDLLVEGIQPWLSESFDVTIIEGAGGLFSPLADGMLNSDLVKKLKPDHVIVVAANRLGVIHQCVATARAAQASGMEISGFVLSQVEPSNDPNRNSNVPSIVRYSETPVLASIPYDGKKESMRFLEDWW